MKKFINKKFIVITAVALLLFVTVGSTLAYIFTQTDPVENTFTPSKVSCAVVENGSQTENTGNIVYTGTTKKNVQIKNTGDTDAFIRVAVVVNWVSADGTKVWASAPRFNPVDGSDWIPGVDGYYYYMQPVAPGGFTSDLIENFTKEVTGPVGTDGTQYYLSVEIVASAIQAKGMGVDIDTPQEAWANAQNS